MNLLPSWNQTVIVVVVLIDLAVGKIEPWSQESIDEHRYVAQLLDKLIGPESNYTRHVIPPTSCQEDPDIFGLHNKTASKSCPFIIHMRLFLIRIQDVVENSESLVSTIRLQAGWVDPTLRWDPDEYGGVKQIILPAESLWFPILHIANAGEETKITKGDQPIRVTYMGQVWFHPDAQLSTRCALDLLYYPFDYQRCSIVVESVIYTSKELMIVTRSDKSDPISLGMYSKNPMWSLIDRTGFPALYVAGRNTAFSRIHFWVTLKRKPDHFRLTFLVPLILLSILQLITYFMPMHFVDRVPQATVVMLTAFFLQGYIADSLPRSANGESYVQTYLNLIIALSIITVLVCAITAELTEPDEGLSVWGFNSILRFNRKKIRPKKSPPIRRCGDVVYQVAKMNENAACPEEDRPKKLKTEIVIAALINWFGFALCLGISVIYPVVTFVLIVPRTQPTLPVPPPNGRAASYFGEI